MRALLVLSCVLLWTENATAKELTVDDRIRLLDAMHKCINLEVKKLRKENIEADLAAEFGLKVEGAFKKLVSGEARPSSTGSVMKRVREEFYPVAYEKEVLLAIVDSCFKGAFGEPLGEPSHPQTTPPIKKQKEAVPSKPPEKSSAAKKGLAQVALPAWSCREPEVYVQGDCDQGALGGKNFGAFVARGWQTSTEGTGPAIHCAHNEPNGGHSRTRSWCASTGQELRIGMHNDLLVYGGYTDPRDCGGSDHCLTTASYKVQTGGADIRINKKQAGRFDLVVDAVSCADTAGESAQTQVVLNYAGTPQEVKLGERIHLNKVGLAQALFVGAAEKSSDWPGHKYSAHGRCEVVLSVQEHELRKRKPSTVALSSSVEHVPGR
ncbi:hypothetical protein [Corallococcus carmarthensis]|uniref:Uncharacterized protein n=1 Tax=Corallococcus carmarthensis TaxID=2316728 RepID=A0A3A8JTV6_9BACT|nr:hypothetical protein [Corallococcus carmarthensis]RKG95170.1 hypothetical protein D7X32_39840 [Corallococcus carmarthensis]